MGKGTGKNQEPMGRRRGLVVTMKNAELLPSVGGGLYDPLAGHPSASKPSAISDLKARLELLAKHRVRRYDDGMVHIEIDTAAKPVSKGPQEEFPPIPEM